MSWTIKRWWKTIGLVTLAFEVLCLAISPNILSIGLIPVGMLLVGLAGPSVLWGIEKVADTSKDGISRLGGVVATLFAFSIAKVGFDLVWAAIAVSLAVLGSKSPG